MSKIDGMLEFIYDSKTIQDILKENNGVFTLHYVSGQGNVLNCDKK